MQRGGARLEYIILERVLKCPIILVISPRRCFLHMLEYLRIQPLAPPRDIFQIHSHTWECTLLTLIKKWLPRVYQLLEELMIRPSWCACSIHTSTGTVIVWVFQKKFLFFLEHSSTRDTYDEGRGYIIKKHAQLYTGDSFPFLVSGAATAAFCYQRKR